MKETRMEITHRIRLCKACGMCSKSCPAQINIPEALGIYKEYLAGDMGILEKLDEMESPGKPVDCIECGACSAHCPDGMDVKELVRELAMMQSCRRLMLSRSGGHIRRGGLEEKGYTVLRRSNVGQKRWIWSSWRSWKI